MLFAACVNEWVIHCACVTAPTCAHGDSKIPQAFVVRSCIRGRPPLPNVHGMKTIATQRGQRSTRVGIIPAQRQALELALKLAAVCYAAGYLNVGRKYKRVVVIGSSTVA